MDKNLAIVRSGMDWAGSVAPASREEGKAFAPGCKRWHKNGAWAGAGNAKH